MQIIVYIISIVREIAMATKGKIRDMLKIIRNDGWFQVRSNRGDHRQFRHPTKAGKVTVDGKESDDVAPKLWNSMLSQAGLR